MLGGINLKQVYLKELYVCQKSMVPNNRHDSAMGASEHQVRENGNTTAGNPKQCMMKDMIRFWSCWRAPHSLPLALIPLHPNRLGFAGNGMKSALLSVQRNLSSIISTPLYPSFLLGGFQVSDESQQPVLGFQFVFFC